MKIQVEMTAEEFQEFFAWKKDKDCYERELREMDGKFEMLHKKVLWALDEDSKRPGKVKIIDQEQASELVEMSSEWFA